MKRVEYVLQLLDKSIVVTNAEGAEKLLKQGVKFRVRLWTLK